MSATAHLLPAEGYDPTTLDRVITIYVNVLFKEELTETLDIQINDNQLKELLERCYENIEKEEHHLIEQTVQYVKWLIQHNPDLIILMILVRIIALFSEEDQDLNTEFIFAMQDLCCLIQKQYTPIKQLFLLISTFIEDSTLDICSEQLRKALYSISVELDDIVVSISPSNVKNFIRYELKQNTKKSNQAKFQLEEKQVQNQKNSQIQDNQKVNYIQIEEKKFEDQSIVQNEYQSNQQDQQPIQQLKLGEKQEQNYQQKLQQIPPIKDTQQSPLENTYQQFKFAAPTKDTQQLIQQDTHQSEITKVKLNDGEQFLSQQINQQQQPATPLDQPQEAQPLNYLHEPPQILIYQQQPCQIDQDQIKDILIQQKTTQDELQAQQIQLSDNNPNQYDDTREILNDELYQPELLKPKKPDKDLIQHISTDRKDSQQSTIYQDKELGDLQNQEVFNQLCQENTNITQKVQNQYERNNTNKYLLNFSQLSNLDQINDQQMIEYCLLENQSEYQSITIKLDQELQDTKNLPIQQRVKLKQGQNQLTNNESQLNINQPINKQQPYQQQIEFIRNQIMINIQQKMMHLQNQSILISDLYRFKIQKYYINKLGKIKLQEIFRRYRLKTKLRINKNTKGIKFKMEERCITEIKKILINQPKVLRSENIPHLTQISQEIFYQLEEIRSKAISIDQIKLIKKEISLIQIQSKSNTMKQFQEIIQYFNHIHSQEELQLGSQQALGNLDYALMNEYDKPSYKMLIQAKNNKYLIIFKPEKLNELIEYIITIPDINSIRAEWSNINCQYDYYLSKFISLNKQRFKQWILDRIPFSIPKIFNYDMTKFYQWKRNIQEVKDGLINSEDKIIINQLIGKQFLMISQWIINKRKTYQLEKPIFILPYSNFKFCINQFINEKILLIGNKEAIDIQIEEIPQTRFTFIRHQTDPNQIQLFIEGSNMTKNESIINQITIIINT